MIPNDTIQALLISSLKGESTITDLLDDNDEIREFQWAGRDFSYPNIRLQVGTNLPVLDRGGPCQWSTLEFTVVVFSEKDSSQEADDIAGVINTFLHQKTLSGSGFTLFKIKSSGLASAVRTPQGVWRANVGFRTEYYES